MSKVTAKLARARMDAAREDEAGKLLAWEGVADAIGTAAGRGLGATVFAPPVGVSLKATTAAAELIVQLEAAGFRVQWRERRDAGDALNHDLVVSWEGAAIGA